uniref:Uncharacterized protein n=1 Tax=Timema douglasi TaxID=61478 RepID=A0A7R8VGV2_TIMDO|nr:unnamed protein product [Timema douglasi]
MMIKDIKGLTLTVDIDTQEDMDIAIKSEPDNYKSCFVKLQDLTDGFLKILENIKVDTNTQEDVVIPIKSEMDNLKPCCVKLERLSDTFIATGKHIKKNKGKLICPILLGQVQGGGENIEYERTKSLKKCIGEGCSKSALVGGNVIRKAAQNGSRGEVDVINMEEPGRKRHVKKKSALEGLRGEVNVLNMEESVRLVKKKGALDLLGWEINAVDVLDMEAPRRNVMKLDALNSLKVEESVLNMEVPEIVKKKCAIKGPLREVNVLNMEEQATERYVMKKSAINGLRGEVNALNMEEQDMERNVMKKSAINRLRGEVNVLNMEEQDTERYVMKKSAINSLRGERRLTLNGQRELQSFISGGGKFKPSITWSLEPPNPCVYKGELAHPLAACVPHSRPVDSPRSEHDHHPSSPLRTNTVLSQEVNRKLTPIKRVDRRRSGSVHSPPPSYCAFKEILVLSGDDTTMVQVNSSWNLIPPPSSPPSVIRSVIAISNERNHSAERPLEVVNPSDEFRCLPSGITLKKAFNGDFQKGLNKGGLISFPWWVGNECYTLTHFPFNPGFLPDVLDFVVSRGIRRRLVLKSLAELDSDHNPVLVNLGCAVSFIDPPEKPNLKRTDWDRFANVLRERLGPTPTFRTAAEIDHGAELIASAIKGSLEASTPRHRPKRAPQASLPDSILRHVREKNRLRKAWQVSRDPVDKANWSRKVHAVREMVREYRNSVWEDKIESLCVQDRSLWQMTRNLMRVPAPRPPIVGRNGVANSDKEKADALAEHLEAQFVPTDNPSDPVHVAHVAQVIELRETRQPVPNFLYVLELALVLPFREH